MDFGTKKKKKKKGKKKGFDLDAAEAALEAGADTGDAGGAAAPAAPAATPAAPAAAPGDADVTSAVDYATLDTDFVLPAKKKRKRAKVQEEFSLEEEVEESDTTASTIEDNFAWSGSDRDYQYAELLERVFDIMRAKNPGMVQGERRKFVMKPPQVIRLGSKKSGFINFIEICKLMHRQSDHVLNYLFAELGTTGNLDGSEVLVLKGRFQQRQMESVLRRYIRKLKAKTKPPKKKRRTNWVVLVLVLVLVLVPAHVLILLALSFSLLPRRRTRATVLKRRVTQNMKFES